MTVKFNPPGTPLPLGHPFATPRIIFAPKPPLASVKGTGAPMDAPATEARQAGEVDIADEAFKEFGAKKP